VISGVVLNKLFGIIGQHFSIMDFTKPFGDIIIVLLYPFYYGRHRHT